MQLSTMGYMVNDQPCEGLVKLKVGDTLQVGEEAFRIRMDNVEERAAAMFEEENTSFDSIRFTAIGDSIGSSFVIPLFGDAITVGRSKKCDVCIDDGACSREHLQIIPSGKTMQIVDNYSANGSFLNEEKFSKIRARAGDILELGRNVYVIHFD